MLNIFLTMNSLFGCILVAVTPGAEVVSVAVVDGVNSRTM